MTGNTAGRSDHDDQPGESVDPAADAGSVSAEEGVAAMAAAEDAIVDPAGDDS